MNGTRHLAYSRLSRILATHRFTVADLCKRLSRKGVPFDRKTVYRLAGFKPMQTINASILGAVCAELEIGIGDLIAWEPSKPELHRIDEKTQKRLTVLMIRSNEGQLTNREARELAELGDYAENLSLENARILADAAAAAKRSHPAAPPQNRALAISAARKPRKKVPA